MPKPSDQTILDMCKSNWESANTDNADLRENIENSDDLYFGRKPGAAPTGRSSAVTLDCQAMCTAVTADVVQGFTSDIPAQFEKIGDDDESAEAESYAVSQAIEENGGFTLLSAAIDSALRYGLSVAHVWVEERTELETEVLPAETSREDLALLQATAEQRGLTIKETRRNQDEIQVEVERQVVELKIEPVDVSLIRYPKDHPRPTTEGMRFFGVQHHERRAEVLNRWPNKKDAVEKAPASSISDPWDSATRSKLPDQTRSPIQATTPENDMIRRLEMYQEVPIGNGRTELYRVNLVEWEILDAEPWRGPMPFAVGTAFPQPHRFKGISLVDKLADVQERGSYATRQLEDNLQGGNMARSSGYNINLNDRLSGRANGHIRLNSPDASYQEFPPLDQASQSLAYLQWLTNQRSERGGAALDMQSNDSQLVRSQIGAAAAGEVLGHQESISAYIARNLAETFLRSLWLRVHERLRYDFTGAITVRQSDQAQQVSPQNWTRRTRLSLKSGMSMSERRKKTANLMQLFMAGASLRQAGSTLVDDDALHAIISDWGYSADLNGINRYVVDPQSPKGKQLAAQAAEQAQAAQALQQMQLKLEEMDRQLKAQELDIERRNNEAEIRWRYYDSQLDAGVKLETTEAELLADAQAQQTTESDSSTERPT